VIGSGFDKVALGTTMGRDMIWDIHVARDMCDMIEDKIGRLYDLK